MQLLPRPGRNFAVYEINFRDDHVTSPEPPVASLDCSGVADNQTGLYTLHLEFSYPNVSLINEAIYEYFIILRNRDFMVGIDPIDVLRETLELAGVLVCAVIVNSNLLSLLLSLAIRDYEVVIQSGIMKI